MSYDQALGAFIAEARELLEQMENAFLTVHEGEPQTEAINAVFRAAHTIKGSAGLFGLDHIVAFTHVMESVLDDVRDGKIACDPEMINLLLNCSDHIGLMIDALDAGDTAEDPVLTAQGAPLLVQLSSYLAPKTQHVVVSKAAPSRADTIERIANSGATGASDYWHISLRFGADVLRNGMDPMSFIRYLSTMGRIVAVAVLDDALPAALLMDPESSYLGFEIAFDTQADKAAIEAAFEFVHDDCAIRILPPHSQISEYIRLIHELPETPARLGEIMRAVGSLTERELELALAAQIEASDNPKLGNILVDSGAIPPAIVEAALAKQKPAVEAQARESRSVRVDADKLDQLITLVGELIIAGARTGLLAQRLHNAELQESTSSLNGLVEAVRDSSLQLRMVKIGATFSRFQRVVHDVARELGKDIVLQVSGEDAELDKTVVEKIADPLTHLVRNAMDHGIEPADVRVARGKPAKGTVSLNAVHDSGSIIIEVSDDGGGLKRERILAKAIERGLVDPAAKLSDEEILGLIFAPGFSTAETITNLSGRGVGMDVVKRNIEALRGSVSIASEEGLGTTVRVRLPLTLAIIDSFLVAVDKNVFVIPIDQIEECVEYSSEDGHDYTNLRGEVLPFISLRTLFAIQGAPSRRSSIVVVRHANQRAGLVVDALLGQFQTVIKPMNPVFAGVKCISGSTILGGGEVALIVDVPALLNQYRGKELQQVLA